jgi:hypothetical protein
VRIELGRAAKKFCAAGLTPINAFPVFVEKLTRPGFFGGGLTENGILFATEFFAPLLIDLG